MDNTEKNIDHEAVINPWQVVISSRELLAIRSEIENLQEKLRVKEDEGWEGSRRRAVIKMNITKLLQETIPDRV